MTQVRHYDARLYDARHMKKSQMARAVAHASISSRNAARAARFLFSSPLNVGGGEEQGNKSL
ncbi:MAG: hypothetical protein EBR40_11570 [Proteobacteria bacterium]|nr:hypothetical protein [Pseudomonadota bacterium]